MLNFIRNSIGKSSSGSSSLSVTWYFPCLNVSHSIRCIVASYCGFNLNLKVANDIKHLCTCLFAIQISSLMKCLFNFFSLFIELLCFLLLIFESFLFVLGTLNRTYFT